jgi:hypothetical protein
MAVTWLSKFCTWILGKLADRFAWWLITVEAPPLLVTLWGWVRSDSSIRTYELVGLIVFPVLSLPFWFFLRFMMNSRGRVKHPRDIAGVIDYWLTMEINGQPSGVKSEPFDFAEFENELNLKRGTSRKFLPMIALQRGYDVDVGNKRFRVIRLTPGDNRRTRLTQWLEECATKQPSD